MRKKNLIKKSLVYALTGSMLFSNISPAFAYTYKDSVADVEYTDVIENATNNTTVYAEIGSFFKVTIPKHIILSGSTKTGAYTVGVEGDIAGTEIVNVIPDKSFALKSNFLKDVTASIEQDKVSWTYDEMLENTATIGNGSIDANGITAGSWNGNFNFNINLENSITEEDSKVEISFDDETTKEITIDAGNNAQIDVFLGDEKVNEEATWNSDNENVTVDNGYIEVSESAEDGEVANITATLEDKTITITIIINKEEESPLQLSMDEVIMGSGDSTQVIAYFNGEDVTNDVTWNSDNENITVENGLIETKASAKVGDTATITVTAENTVSTFSNRNTTQTNDKIEIELEVTIIDMEFKSNDEVITSVDLKVGGSQQIEVTIIPESVSGLVTWTSTANSGINLIKYGNKVTIKIAEDMEAGNSYSVIASYGDFSKLLKINIVSDHEHSYTEEITKEATCAETGIITYTCECSHTYTEEIPVNSNAHNYESKWTTTLEPTCTEAGYKMQYCSICTYALNEEEIPATGHDYVSNITKEATCTEDGNTHYECNNCDSAYDEVIDALGHIYDSTKYVTDVAATCSTEGSKSVHCNVCSAKITGTEVTIPATGEHNLSKSVENQTVVLTNTENGNPYYFVQNGTKYTSNNKGITSSSAISTWTILLEKDAKYPIIYKVSSEANYDKLLIDIDGVNVLTASGDLSETTLNVDLTAGTHTIVITYEKDGSGDKFDDCAYVILNNTAIIDTHICSQCDLKEAHTYDDGIITTSPTCTTTGVKTYTCKCNDSYTETIKANGHTWGEWQEQVAPTCGTAGKNIRYCTVEECDGSSTQSVAATGNHTIVGTACSVCGRPTIESGEPGIYGVDTVQTQDWDELVSSRGVYVTGTTLTDINYSLKGTLIISNNITTIGDNAFTYADYLTNVIMPSSVTTLGTNLINGSKIKEITLSKNITTIPESCFSSCGSLQTVNIPSDSKLTTIGANAFYSCRDLANISLPSTIKTIGDKAFYYSNYESAVGTLDGSIIISDNANCTIGESNFCGLKNVGHIDLGGTTSLGKYSIQACQALKSVDLGNKLTKIENGIVYNCDAITSVGGINSGADVIIPNTVTFIGGSCFSDLKSVKTIEIPSTVTKMSAGGGTLSYNPNCESIKVNGAVTLIDEEGYLSGLGAYSSGTLYIKKINTDSDSGIGYFYGTEVTIGGGLLSDRFAINSPNITKVTLGNESTTTFDGILHFTNATKLTSLTLGNYVTNLGGDSFYKCTGLTSVTIPSSVTSMDRDVFDGCTNLTSVIFKDTTTWYYGTIAGDTANTISSSNLSNPTTAAQYLTNNYKSYYWTKK